MKAVFLNLHLGRRQVASLMASESLALERMLLEFQQAETLFPAEVDKEGLRLIASDGEGIRFLLKAAGAWDQWYR